MKNLFKELLRHKSVAILNIIGLSCAFATAIIISMQIRYDVTFDHHNKNFESIYQLQLLDTVSGTENGGVKMALNRHTPIAIKTNTPKIEHIVTCSSGYSEVTVLVDSVRAKEKVNAHVTRCEADITKIFTFDFIEGDTCALDDPNNAIISKEFAEQWFSSKSAIGEKLFLNDKVFTVAAIYNTFPKNSTLTGSVFINLGDENMNSPQNWNYQVYIKTVDGYSTELLDSDIDDVLSKVESQCLANSIPISEWHEAKNAYTMIAIAILIILLATINFINFSTSMVPIKIKGINLKKVVGATNLELRLAMICESIILVLISLFIAVSLVEIFKNNELSYIIGDVSWESNKIVYYLIFIIAIITGVVSGLYPAFYSTSFQPALVLKSSYAMTASGVRFRKALIGFQFFIALCFIATTIFIHLQHSYMLNRSGGYTKEGIIHVFQGGYVGHEHLRAELLKNPKIKDLTFSRGEFGTQSHSMSWTRGYSKGQIFLMSIPVAHNFLDFFGIEMISGRDFIESDESSENGYFIMNKTAMDKYEFVEGEQIYGHIAPTDIIGVCEDVNFKNMRVTIEPQTFYIFGKHPWGPLQHAYIKVSDSSKEVFEYIRECYKKTDPDAIVEIALLTTRLEKAYSSEDAARKAMQTCSMIAIVIALMGVFGLVSFDTKFRRKEIGLRRIHGATVSNILTMFSTTYIGIILISFVISIPVVYLIISKWLTTFPYKIDIYWWVFAIALAMVLILTISISVVQTMRSARENPTDSIK